METLKSRIETPLVWSTNNYLILAWWCRMVRKIWVNIGLDNGLVPDGITWTNVDLSWIRSSGIHLRAIWLQIPQPSVTKISFESAYLKYHSYLPRTKVWRIDNFMFVGNIYSVVCIYPRYEGKYKWNYESSLYFASMLGHCFQITSGGFLSETLVYCLWYLQQWH